MDEALFHVRDISGKGKGAVAARSFGKETVVLRCEPLFALLDLDAACSWCYAESDAFGPPMRRKCKACAARYCSDRCMELSRGYHCQIECRAFAGCSEDDEDVDDVRAVLLLDALRQAGRGGRFDNDLCWQRELDVGRLARVATKAARVLGRPVSSEETELILGKVRSNSFGLDVAMRSGETNEAGEPDVNFLGHAVFEEASFFNHTCEPANIVRVRVGRKLFFVSTRAVEQGEELCITYINSARHKQATERQALLFELYGFHCSCGVCVGSAALPARQCARCGCCEFVGNSCCVCDAQQIAERFGEET